MLIELDENVAAVWQAILNGQGEELINKIGEFQVSHQSVRAVLDRPRESLLERAFATILRNRVQRGGILAPGASLMKYGENGRGLLSRWYPQTLAKRIQDILSKKDKITFVHGDGMKWMQEYADQTDVVFFVDPPYTMAGRRLYLYSDIDHHELFRVASTLQGDFLMTYDDAEPIRDLAEEFRFDVHVALMKNTHHRIMKELLIGRDLGWARTHPSQLGQYPLFEVAQT